MSREPEIFWLIGATAVFIMAGATIARGHSWYDPWCCNDSDCRQIDAEEVRIMADGYHYRQWVIPYKDARVSVDRDYHACEFPKGTMRCFYAPAGAS